MYNNHLFYRRGNIQLFYPAIGTLRSWQQTTKIAAEEGATGWSGDRPAGEEGEEEVKWLVPLPPSLFFIIVPNRIWKINLVESIQTLITYNITSNHLFGGSKVVGNL